MKNKCLKLGCILLLLGVFSFLSAQKYQKLNKIYQKGPVVSEKKIVEKQLIKLENLEFVVEDSVIRQEDETYYGDITLSIINKKKNNYGFKKQNVNVMENMFLTIPYSIAIPAIHVENVDGTMFHLADVKLNQRQTMKIHFKTDIKNYQQRNESSYFSFLMPEKDNKFTNYVLVLAD